MFLLTFPAAPLPPAFEGDQELIDIYRSSMDKKAETFREVAVNLFEHCLNVSTKVRWFNENSTRCETAAGPAYPRSSRSASTPWRHPSTTTTRKSLRR